MCLRARARARPRSSLRFARTGSTESRPPPPPKSGGRKDGRAAAAADAAALHGKEAKGKPTPASHGSFVRSFGRRNTLACLWRRRLHAHAWQRARAQARARRQHCLNESRKGETTPVCARCESGGGGRTAGGYKYNLDLYRTMRIGRCNASPTYPTAQARRAGERTKVDGKSTSYE